MPRGSCVSLLALQALLPLNALIALDSLIALNALISCGAGGSRHTPGMGRERRDRRITMRWSTWYVVRVAWGTKPSHEDSLFYPFSKKNCP